MFCVRVRIDCVCPCKCERTIQCRVQHGSSWQQVRICSTLMLGETHRAMAASLAAAVTASETVWNLH